MNSVLAARHAVQAFAESGRIKDHFATLYQHVIVDVAQDICRCLKNHGKILLFGNGGSAADAQHIAAEFVGRYKRDRKPLAAIALTTDTSILTSLANDFGYARVFERQIQALGNAGDAVIGISTSGNSPNVVHALMEAKLLGMLTVGFTGAKIGDLDRYCTYVLKVPSEVTSRIQEAHITLGHVICELVEQEMFPK